jgi:hypothetical protein
MLVDTGIAASANEIHSDGSDLANLNSSSQLPEVWSRTAVLIAGDGGLVTWWPEQLRVFFVEGE